MSLYSKDLARKGKILKIQRRELVSNSYPPDTKTQDKKESEEMRLFNVLNLGDPGLGAERFASPPSLLLDRSAMGLRGVTAPLRPDEGMVSPWKTWQGTQFGEGTSLSGERQFPVRQYL